MASLGREGMRNLLSSSGETEEKMRWIERGKQHFRA
jgi:hypothetical protein